MTMKFQCTKLANGNVRVGPVRLSYPELFRAKAMEAGKTPVFSSSIMFPKGADLKVLKQAVKDAATEKWGGKPPKNLSTKYLFRDQGEKDSEGYEDGAIFFNASSQRRPPVVNRKREEIVDEEDVYPGVNALVTVKPFAYPAGDTYGAGVSWGLQAVQILGGGERLGGGVANPEDEFEELDEIAEGDSADAVFNDGAGAEDDDPLAGL